MSFVTQTGIDFNRLLDYPARFFPNKTALVDETSEVTFAQADHMSSALAAAFLEVGAKAGDRVALILPNGIPFIITEMAAIKAGMVKVPLNIRFHVKEVAAALEDCAPAILVCGKDYLTELGAVARSSSSLKAIFTVGGTSSDSLSYEAATERAPLPRPASYDPDAPLLIRYTGGTTGRAKGIVHTARAFLNINLDVLREFPTSSADVFLHLGHLSHGVNFQWAAFYAHGATQVLRERFEPTRVLREIGIFNVTFIYMVPTMIHRLLRGDDGTADVSSLKTFLYASAPMPVPLLREAIARYGPIFTQVYTLSEAPVVTTILRPEEHVEKETIVGPRLASCGREVVTMEIRLLDDDGLEVAPGEPGEIAVRSVNNMASYWNRPEETAVTLVDGWVMTGDVARRDEDGYLYVVDRKKDMIITGALNVYPKEVEDVLHGHPAVAEAAVIGVPDEEWGEIIRAYIVAKPGIVCSESELVQHCQDNLAGYKKPREVVFMESLPLSPVGKVSRARLRELARTETGTGAGSI